MRPVLILVHLSLLCLSLLCLPPAVFSYAYHVYNSSACAVALQYPVLDAVIAQPSLYGAACAELPVAMQQPGGARTSSVAFVRFSYSAAASGVHSDFTLFANASCSDAAVLWRIAVTASAAPVTCTPALLLARNVSTQETSSTAVWITIDMTVPAAPTPSWWTLTIGPGLVLLVVSSFVCVACAVVFVIWWVNRRPKPPAFVSSPDADWYTALVGHGRV